MANIDIVKFFIADERRSDVVERDVWPQENMASLWLYEPFPNEGNRPLVGPRYLMNAWRDPHHTDVAAYNEFYQRASWAARTKDWLRNAPFVWLQSRLSSLDNISDDDGLDPTLVDNNLPPRIHMTDNEQPTDQTRSARIFAATPKKTGPKLVVNYRDNTYPEAWGLEVEEGFCVHRLLFFLLILYASASLAVMSWLLQRYGARLPDSPGVVIGVIGWISGLIGLMFTVWFKWAGG